eukprot:g55590.t1
MLIRKKDELIREKSTTSSVVGGPIITGAQKQEARTKDVFQMVSGLRITMQELLLILLLLLCIKILTQKKKEVLMMRLCCLLLLGFHRDWSKPYLTQDVLLGLNESPWIKNYNKRDDKALLQILNLNINWHDARIAVPLFEFLDDDTPAPFNIVGD